MRSFIAVSPDAATRQRIGEALAPLRAALPAMRWVRDDHLHVTLAFLGDVEDDRLHSIIHAVGPVVADASAFHLTVAGGGVFPSWARPRVAWLAFARPDALVSLAASVRRACQAAGWVADRDFAAHLTVGRTGRPLPPAERDRLREGLAAVRLTHPFDVSRVEVLHSVLGPGGPRHTVVAALPLRPA